VTSLEAFFSRETATLDADPGLRASLDELIEGLEAGELRAARRLGDGTWEAVAWVKAGILAGFRASAVVPVPGWPGGARDKELFFPRELGAGSGVRLVPGGSAVRRGAFLSRGVVVMPPAYVNVGAWVGEGTMIDSHALVGSCAQVGARVHLSAGAQIGGVLEPAGSRPVIVEDGAFVGALCALVEGVVVREGAVLAPGTIVSRATPVLDLVRGGSHRGEVPAGAVVVPGSRPASGPHAAGLSLYAPVIVKYRDASTDAATVLEEALRG